MNSEILFFFSALGAFNGFMLSAYFAINANKKKFSNYFLALLLLTLSIRVLKSVFFYFNPELSNSFIQIGLSACILIGPFLYLYVKSQTTDEKQNWYIHILPYLLGITIFGLLYPYVEHRWIWHWIVKSIYLQWLVYIVFSTKYIMFIFHKLKEKENLNHSDVWLLSIYAGVAFIWLAYYCIAAYTSYILGALSFTFILYLVILLLIFKKNQSTTFFQEKERYKNKELDDPTIEDIKQKLTLFAEKEFYLNPNLTLDQTAKELNISKHLLSQYLNEKLGKSFTHFMNEFRIEKAKQLLQSQTNYTIEGLGYESGFQSKSTFFSTFKKITGKTPAEYQKMHSN